MGGNSAMATSQLFGHQLRSERGVFLRVGEGAGGCEGESSW